MLDAFEILTTSGIVLWRRHYTPDFSPHVINNLVSDVLIEEKRDLKGTHDGEAKSYRKDRYTLKWTSTKDVGLCFVAVYNALINLSWVDDLLAAVKTLFLKQYGAELKKPDRVHLDTHQFDQTFNALIQRLDTGSTARRQSDSEGPVELTPPSSSAGEDHDAEREEPPPPPPGALKKATPALRKDDVVNSSTDATPVVTPDASRPSTPSGHLLQAKSGPGGKTSRRARKAQHLQATPGGTPGTSGDEAGSRSIRGKGTAKAKRRWDESGVAVEDTGDDSTLDYSATADADTSAIGADEDPAEIQNADSSQMGQRTGKGEFVLKDLDDEIESILAQQQSKSTSSSKTKPSSSEPNAVPDEEHHGLLGSTTTRITSLFQNLVGGRTLTKQDLHQPLQQMQNALLQKNVAREAAERLAASVEKDLLDSRTASFTSIDATIRSAMEKALTRMLTPTTSLDLLREITRTTTSTTTNTTRANASPARPYVISIVGVNGVGKSTNLSKIAYFLLQNHFRVLVVAGDTFRSGAVEQLRVHVRNLSELARREKVGKVELFDRGYGGDAAGVAREAIKFASQPPAAGAAGLAWDVVLIDTAGRRHNDTRLMSSLTKFSQLAQPDKVFMVGEALVGTDSVAQARNFAREFVDAK
ncbi:P-loop containing nucleoside triphosphate hydrolase protein, partial [Hortaea werneckii]